MTVLSSDLVAHHSFLLSVTVILSNLWTNGRAAWICFGWLWSTAMKPFLVHQSYCELPNDLWQISGVQKSQDENQELLKPLDFGEIIAEDNLKSASTNLSQISLQSLSLWLRTFTIWFMASAFFICQNLLLLCSTTCSWWNLSYTERISNFSLAGFLSSFIFMTLSADSRNNFSSVICFFLGVLETFLSLSFLLDPLHNFQLEFFLRFFP